MDKVHEVLMKALRQALGSPEEVRLYKSGKFDGLFPSRAGASGEAAEFALRKGLIEVVRSEHRGKTVIDWVRPTPEGVDFLHEKESPLQALREVQQALRLNRTSVPVWLAEMRSDMRTLEQQLAKDAQQWIYRLETLERRVEETLLRIERAMPLVPEEIANDYPWASTGVKYLDRRQDSGATENCELPELFAALVRQYPDLTLSNFHDGLRRMSRIGLLELRPADNPNDLPQPEFALLDGSAVCYFVCR